MPVTCPSCGVEAATSDARHCHNCGSPLPAPDDPRRASHPAGGPPQAPGGRGPSGAGDQSPRPAGVSSDSRTWGMLAHLSALVGLVIGFGFLGPLVVWLIRRDQDPYVDYHGKEALNFNISVLLYALVSGLLILVLIGVVLLAVVGIGWLVLTIVAGVRASNGEYYRYPLTIRFVS